MYCHGGLQGLCSGVIGQFLNSDSELPQKAAFSAWRIDILKMSPGAFKRQAHRLPEQGETWPKSGLCLGQMASVQACCATHYVHLAERYSTAPAALLIKQ